MKKLLLGVIALAAVGLSACKDDDVKRKDISVEFASTAIGIEAADQSEEVAVTLSRTPDQAITATIAIAAEDVEYGTHFTTSPAAADGVIELTLPVGKTSVPVAINKVAGVSYDGNEKVTFTISALSAAEGYKIGTKNSVEVSFGGIVSQSGQMTLEGNGNTGDAEKDKYLNSVYVDLSGNKQTAVDRTSWNLGLACGEEFRVVLNGAYATAASATDKTDINAVGIAEADAHTVNLNTAGAMGADATQQSPAFDSSDGNFATTAFAEVSANDADNKVYFVASAPQKTASRGDWFKVRVTRKDNGYSVEYGKVSGGSVKTIDVPKKDGYNFVFLSLENDKIVDVEPMAAKWDIKWSYDYGAVAMGGATYYMVTQDFISINNHGGVKVAAVMTADKTYDSITKADINGLTFKGDRDEIGSSWRATSMGGSGGGVVTDRFYVIQDPAGYHYKLRFTRVGINDPGTRGRPELEYALID